MGMFDTVRSSLQLFSPEADRSLQTKSLEGLMFEYWISPAGELFQVDFSHTHDLHQVPEGERKHRLHVWDWKPNGNRGRVRFVPWEGPVIAYPAKWDVDKLHWPQAEIYFHQGVVEAVDITIRHVRQGW